MFKKISYVIGLVFFAIFALIDAKIKNKTVNPIATDESTTCNILLSLKTKFEKITQAHAKINIAKLKTLQTIKVFFVFACFLPI